MRIAIAQINPIIGDFEYNTSLIIKASEQARKEGCSLAIFPELTLSGYPPKDLLEKSAFVDENLIQLKHLAAQIKGIHILCGYVDKNPQKTGKPLINAVALIGQGQ
ncbi:MAG: NAD+ synthase, partial [candidate division Zixibacteria bacterium]|nr:NAD+ synthase [candidate division Zixibacteria bacterium]